MASAKRGKFISLEGIEGVGKTTNIRFLDDLLAKRGVRCELSREPGGTERAEAIRQLVLEPADEELCSLSELLLMFASRAQHVEHRIRPCIERGDWLICDRFTDATLAYQGYGRGQSLARIRTLADWAHGDLWPDMTLLLDLPYAVSVSRRESRQETDRFEQQRLEFFDKVRQGYLKLAAAEPERFVVIDADQALQNVQRDIAKAISNILN